MVTVDTAAGGMVVGDMADGGTTDGVGGIMVGVGAGDMAAAAVLLLGLLLELPSEQQLHQHHRLSTMHNIKLQVVL